MSAFATSVVVPQLSRLLLGRSSRLHRACVVWGGVCHRFRAARARRFDHARQLRFISDGAEESAVDITSKGVIAPTPTPVRNTSGPAIGTRRGPQRSLRRTEPKPLVEIRATQLAARRRRTVWRNLRARCQRLDRAVLGSINGGEPCIGFDLAHRCEQLGPDLDLATRLCEEGGDE